MSQVIRIPTNIFSRLEHHAVGFDTPANVIERLLDHYENSSSNIEESTISIKNEDRNMTVKIEDITKEFEEKYNIILSKLQGKKIIYTGKTPKNESLIVIMPASKVYNRGNGWVDFTEVQINKLKEYTVAIVAFRLSDGTVYYIDFNQIYLILTENNILENDHEGRHWKIDIWPTKLVVRNGGESLSIQANEKAILNVLL